jgi:hypothetical protein
MPFKLKKEKVLHPFGPNTAITHKELTDEIALYHLNKHPEDIELFADGPEVKAFIESKQEKPSPDGSGEGK